MIFGFLVVIITIIAVLLVLVILLQSGKGGGLAGVGAGGASQILGARQAPDVLEKGTWLFGALFIALCVLTNFAIDRGPGERSVVQQSAPAQQAPVQQAPIDQVPGGAPAPAPLPDGQ